MGMKEGGKGKRKGRGIGELLLLLLLTVSYRLGDETQEGLCVGFSFLQHSRRLCSRGEIDFRGI
jgi:hypothetical protein